MNHFLLIAILTALWCLFHSLLITHRWQKLVRRLFPRHHGFSRMIYVTGSVITLGSLMLWIRTLPGALLFDWPGGWAWVRWLGLGVAALLTWQGARCYNSAFFLGLSQARDQVQGRPVAPPPFQADGILAVIRHPWYTGALLVLVCGLPLTDANLVWRGVFLVYILVGTELEEPKLLQDLGEPYRAYRRRVPRYLPGPASILRRFNGP